MKSHGVFKFIAIGLCALCLLSACGGLAGIICLSEGDLYNKTVDECLAQRTNDYAAGYANQVALEYAGKILGGCPSEMLRAQADEMYGSPDWFYRLYPDYGYEILDAEGRVVSSYNLENAKANPSSVCYSYPETGKYMHFVGLAGQTELEEERLPRTVEEGEEYLYDAVQPMGSYVIRMTVGYPDGSEITYGGAEDKIGLMIHDEMGRVLFRGFEPDWEIISNRPNYIQCLGTDGEMVYEASCANVDAVGTLTYDESGYLVFRSNDPEPEVVGMATSGKRPWAK